MPQRSLFSIVVLLGGALAALAGCTSSGAATQPSPNPVVVELFQSQGCSSCPPANADLNAIADRGDVLALSFAVTYWDRLGWSETFGSLRYTERQQDYARAGRGQVATPEFIVNGSRAVIGANRPALEDAVRRGFPASGPAMSGSANHVRIEAQSHSAPATAWLVRYDPQIRAVPIRASENGGRTLPHRSIVRELVRLGDWRGPAASLVLPAARETGLSSAILVQRGSGGPIISARKL